MRILNWFLTALIGLAILALTNCAPPKKNAAKDSPFAATANLPVKGPFGSDANGTEYTGADSHSATLMDELNKIIPATPENTAFAQNHRTELRFLNAKNEVIETIDDATRVWVVLNTAEQDGTHTYQYILDRKALKMGSEIAMAPVDEVSKRFDVTLTCKDEACTTKLIRPSLHSGAAAPVIKPQDPAQPQTAQPEPTPEPEKGWFSWLRWPWSSSKPAGPQPPKPGTPAAPPTVGAKNPNTVQTGDIITDYNAQVRILVSAPDLEAIQKTSGHPELAYLVERYKAALAVHATSTLTPGRTRAQINLPISSDGKEKLCLEIDLKDTQDHASSAKILCGDSYFSHAQLAGNSAQGWLAVILFSKARPIKLALEILLDPSANPAATKSQTVTRTNAPIEQVNANAFLKIDLRGQRTARMTQLMQNLVPLPEEQARLDELKTIWQGSSAKFVQAFFASSHTNSVEVHRAYGRVDLPVDLSLLTIVESPAFFVSGEVQAGAVTRVGKNQDYDCPVGPSQILFSTAKELIEKYTTDLAGFALTPPQVIENPNKCAKEDSQCKRPTHICRADIYNAGNDARADFIKASKMTAFYLADLAVYFHRATGKDQDVVDPRILLAAYNRGQRNVENDLVAATAQQATKTKGSGFGEAVARKYEGKRLERDLRYIFDLAGVYPDIWQLCSLKSFRPQTCNYALNWTVLRQINQNPASFGFSAPAQPVTSQAP